MALLHVCENDRSVYWYLYLLPNLYNRYLYNLYILYDDVHKFYFIKIPIMHLIFSINVY